MTRSSGEAEDKDHQEFEKNNVEIDIYRTPAELAELNKICE